MKIILQGPPGSGKTTLAKTLLNDIDWRYAATIADVERLDASNCAIFLDNASLHIPLLRKMEEATTHIVATTIQDIVPETSILIFHLQRVPAQELGQ